MRLENATEGQRHYTYGGESVVVPAKRGGVVGSADVGKAFVEAAKADPIFAADLKTGDLAFIEGPRAAPAPVKTDDEKAAANVAAVMERAEVDKAAVAAKDKPKK